MVFDKAGKYLSTSIFKTGEMQPDLVYSHSNSSKWLIIVHITFALEPDNCNRPMRYRQILVNEDRPDGETPMARIVSPTCHVANVSDQWASWKFLWPAIAHPPALDRHCLPRSRGDKASSSREVLHTLSLQREMFFYRQSLDAVP
jgi:hypothetical protein